MQLTDTLDAGGAERVAVNLANRLPRDRFESFLCTTRRDGPLERLLRSDVGRARLHRRSRFDVSALASLARFNRQHGIEVLHAHATAIFVASAVARLAPYPSVVWHDHYGNADVEGRSAWLYRAGTRGAQFVIAVNESLARWAHQALGFPEHRVRYIPNFADGGPGALPVPKLPGTPGTRVVCVANFRPQKDLLTLIAAFAQVRGAIPSAHLLLVGSRVDAEYATRIEAAAAALGPSVTILGERDDVSAVLKGCDVGVLSSASEGLPLALLEYGQAGLAVAATAVGQVAEVLDRGNAGLLVPVRDAGRMADALMELLSSEARRTTLGAALADRVRRQYSATASVSGICEIYSDVARSRCA
jgi:glycosyltransferase involved in cell wall biosynthesis